jgi:Fe-S-cluster-containing hydrogenase component 2
LEVGGFDRVAEEISVVEGAVVRLECERVLGEDSVAGATRVPCLGGLGTDDLLTLREAAGDRAIRLLDRGWCTNCPAGGGDFTLDDVITPARATLAAIGYAPALLPAIERRPLPVARRDDESTATSAMSRRALFRRLSAGAPTPHPADDPRFPPAARRRAENDTILRLAQRAGRDLPALFPRAAIAETCSDHRICAAACPTGALAVYERGTTRGVVFESARCLACGRCESVCPTGSIQIAAVGAYLGKTTLTAHDFAVCPKCEGTFVDRDGMGICPTCRKEKSILSALFASRTSIQREESVP